MSQLNDAWAVLKDPDQRRRYDAFLRNGGNGHSEARQEPSPPPQPPRTEPPPRPKPPPEPEPPGDPEHVFLFYGVLITVMLAAVIYALGR